MRWSLSKSGAMALNKWQCWGSLWSRIGLYRILGLSNKAMVSFDPDATAEEPHFVHHLYDGWTLRSRWEELFKPAQRITIPRFQHRGIPKQSFLLWCSLRFLAGDPEIMGFIHQSMAIESERYLATNFLMLLPVIHFLLWRSVLVISRFTQDFGAFKWPSTIRHHWYHGIFNQIDRFPPKKNWAAKGPWVSIILHPNRPYNSVKHALNCW